jgi:hypothetical protein
LLRCLTRPYDFRFGFNARRQSKHPAIRAAAAGHPRPQAGCSRADRSALVSRMVHPNRSLVAGVGGCLRLPYFKGTSANRSSAANQASMSDTIGQQIRLPRLGAGPDASPGNRNALKHGKYHHSTAPCTVHCGRPSRFSPNSFWRNSAGGERVRSRSPVAVGSRTRPA